MKAQSTEPPRPSPSPEVEFRGKMVPQATLNNPGTDPERNLPKPFARKTCPALTRLVRNGPAGN